VLTVESLCLQPAKNECGGILACVSTQDDARSFCQANLHLMQKTPYQQCSLSFRSQATGQLFSSKFTSLTSEQLTMAMVRVTDDEYMLHNHMITEPTQDCFYKLDQYLN